MIFNLIALLAAVFIYRDQTAAGQMVYATTAGIAAGYFVVGFVAELADRVTGGS